MSSSRFIVSEETGVRWADGNIVVHRRGADEFLLTEDDSLLELLHAFSRPRYPAEVVLELTELDSEDAEQAIATLVEEEILEPVMLSRDDFMARLNDRRQELDALIFDDSGRTVSNCGKQKLSPGCQSCKEGRWICVFPGFGCNADCPFCPQPPEARRLDLDGFGRWWIDDFLLALDAHRDSVTGLSISGGELFLNLESAVEITRHVTARLPHVYTWAYTNGIAATSDKLRGLHSAGLQEIRFNLAATGFDSAVIEGGLTTALELFDWVTVEVPACEATRNYLLDDGWLCRLAEMGVKQINLAEVMIPPGPTNATRIFRPFEYELYEFSSTRGRLISPVQSRMMTYDVFEFAARKGNPIRINDCSNEAKLLQETRKAANGLSDLAALASVQAFPRADGR